jgi:hypothetical protein
VQLLENDRILGMITESETWNNTRFMHALRMNKTASPQKERTFFDAKKKKNVCFR